MGTENAFQTFRRHFAAIPQTHKTSRTNAVLAILGKLFFNTFLDKTCGCAGLGIDDLPVFSIEVNNISLIGSFFKSGNIIKVDTLTRSKPNHSLAAEAVYNMVGVLDILPRSLNGGMTIVKGKSDFEILLAVLGGRGRVHFRNSSIHLLGQGDSGHA